MLARPPPARPDRPTPCQHNCLYCRYRFYALFIVFYLAMYAGFATFYASQPGCISKTHNFWHALWFSVTSSATIGEGPWGAGLALGLGFLPVCMPLSKTQDEPSGWLPPRLLGCCRALCCPRCTCGLLPVLLRMLANEPAMHRGRADCA